MNGESLLTLRNGEAVATGAIPVLDTGELRGMVVSSVAAGARIAAMFGQKLPSGMTRIFVLLADDAVHHLGGVFTVVKDTYPAFTVDCPQAHLFEREILEQCGVIPKGHPWLKPVRLHIFHGAVEPHVWQDGKPGNRRNLRPEGHEFFSMNGEEVHEVAVGPVHAGVIEPGHFRFQCHGETVYHLEPHLGYQHRGVEEALVGGPAPRNLAQIEALAGDTTIGHATAYASCIEALAGTLPSQRAQALRALTLELERLANHVGDIGALANDVGFLPTASYCGRLRGDILNMTAAICGSRFGRSMVRPGGVAHDVDVQLAAELLKKLERTMRDVAGAVALFFDTESVRGRMEGTGALSAEACSDLGIVGPAARAAGLVRDCRVDHPAGWYADHTCSAATSAGGDVLARSTVRWDEIRQSAGLVQGLLQNIPRGEIGGPVPRPLPDMLAVSMVEGWRGEIVHVALTDQRGRFSRYKACDPSFHNWSGLAFALRGQQISDFPLCNKSFNLSYCGFDL